MSRFMLDISYITHDASYNTESFIKMQVFLVEMGVSLLKINNRLMTLVQKALFQAFFKF